MFQLHCHPTSPTTAVTSLGVTLDWAADGRLLLRYSLHGAPDALSLPALADQPEQRDGLWQHTCCEAFIAHGDGTAYREFNFSPAGHWALYDFADTRLPAAAPPPVDVPVIATIHAAASLEVAVAIPPTLLPPDFPAWRLGLSAVVEDQAGGKSYWALAHPGPQPDFHRREGFVASVAAPFV